jgi:hypothetical protein
MSGSRVLDANGECRAVRQWMQRGLPAWRLGRGNRELHRPDPIAPAADTAAASAHHDTGAPFNVDRDPARLCAVPKVSPRNASTLRTNVCRSDVGNAAIAPLSQAPSAQAVRNENLVPLTAAMRIPLMDA